MGRPGPIQCVIPLLKVCAIQFLVTFTNMAVVFVPLYLVRTWNMPISEAAIYVGIAAFMGIPGSPLVGELSDRLGWKNVVIVCLLVDSLLLAIFPLTAPGPALVAILAGFGVVNRCISVVLAVGTRASVPSERGISPGLINTLALIAMTLLSVLGGAIADAAGLVVTFLFISGVALLTCLAIGVTRLGKLELSW